MTTLIQQTGQFNGYTLTELRALVLKRLRVNNTTRYSPTAGTADYVWVDDALNRAQENFVKKTRCLRTYAIVELRSGFRSYRLPWNFLDFMAAYYYDGSLTNGYRELTITTIEELNDDVSDWRNAQGTPERIYIDRIYGDNWLFGLYKIPDQDGDTVTIDQETGLITDWICPLFTFTQEYGVIIRMDEADGYIFNTDGGVVAKVTSMNKNLWLEYYRLPELLTNINQRPEIPREYQSGGLVDDAASMLLDDNPEDSAEFKRSMRLEKRTNEEIGTYIRQRKRPLAGHNLQARSHIWNHVRSMPWRRTTI